MRSTVVGFPQGSTRTPRRASGQRPRCGRTPRTRPRPCWTLCSCWIRSHQPRQSVFDPRSPLRPQSDATPGVDRPTHEAGTMRVNGTLLARIRHRIRVGRLNMRLGIQIAPSTYIAKGAMIQTDSDGRSLGGRIRITEGVTLSHGVMLSPYRAHHLV